MPEAVPHHPREMALGFGGRGRVPPGLAIQRQRPGAGPHPRQIGRHGGPERIRVARDPGAAQGFDGRHDIAGGSRGATAAQALALGRGQALGPRADGAVPDHPPQEPQRRPREGGGQRMAPPAPPPGRGGRRPAARWGPPAAPGAHSAGVNHSCRRRTRALRRSGRRDHPLRLAVRGVPRRLAAKARRVPHIRKARTGINGPATGGRVHDGLTRPHRGGRPRLPVRTEPTQRQAQHVRTPVRDRKARENDAPRVVDHIAEPGGALIRRPASRGGPDPPTVSDARANPTRATGSSSTTAM